MSPDQEAEGLTIAQAARRLGVSENAVRQRVKRGSIAAAKTGGVWRVFLPDLPDHQADHDADHQADYHGDQEATGTPTVTPAVREQMGVVYSEWLAPLVNRVAGLERENGRLEQERDQLRAEVERLKTAADVTGQDVPSLPAAASPATPRIRPHPSPAPWWRFWDR